MFFVIIPLIYKNYPKPIKILHIFYLTSYFTQAGLVFFFSPKNINYIGFSNLLFNIKKF
jgi:hypothetical protein